MTAYQIQTPTRQCAATGRELKPGERFYCALLDEAGQLVRKDYAADAWPGAPEGVIAYWCGRIPASDSRRRPTINDEWLFDCFIHLGEAKEPAQKNFRYVIGLLLMRRKRFKFDDVLKRDGEEYLLLRDAKSGTKYEVLDPRLGEAETAAVQDEVFRVLGWE